MKSRKADSRFRGNDEHIDETLGAITLEYAIPGCNFSCPALRHTPLTLIFPPLNRTRGREERARQWRGMDHERRRLDTDVQSAIPERLRRNVIYDAICSGRFRRRRFWPFCRHKRANKSIECNSNKRKSVGVAKHQEKQIPAFAGMTE